MKYISVIMSVYNEPAEWLKNSIESILNQTSTDFEFIIVNDNPERSKLKTALQGYQAKDKRIRLIENDYNIGATKSLNKALALAEGKYIARMDADDISLPHRLQLQYEFLEKHGQIFLVGSAVRTIDRSDKLRAKAVRRYRHERILRDIFSGRLPFYHPSIMFRNEGFKYREKFDTTQDFDLYLILLSAGKKFANLKDVLLYYRMSDQSISGTKRRKQIILKELTLKFYRERETKGFDSYDILDFKNESEVLRFLQIDPKQLEIRAIKEQVTFALGAGNYQAAKQAFDTYRKQCSFTLDKAALWLFTHLPFTHKLYRIICYGMLSKLV